MVESHHFLDEGNSSGYARRTPGIAGFIPDFIVSALVGVISAAADPDFVRLIMGNSYVDMTLDNIANGEPMAVYNSSSEVPMFWESR